MLWTEIQPTGSAENKPWTCIAINDAEDKIVITYGGSEVGSVYVSIDGGNTWAQKFTSLGGKYFQCCAISGDGTMIIVGTRFTLQNSGRLYISLDNGNSYGELRPNGNIDLSWWSIAINYTGQHIVVGAIDDYIYISNDYGETWVKKYLNV